MTPSTLALPAGGLAYLGPGLRGPLFGDLAGLLGHWRQLPAVLRDRLKELFPDLLAVGFLPDEGETINANLVFKNTDVDRGTNIDLGLFTNVAPGETITEATITEPTGTGYAKIVLTDASWTVTADTAAYALQTFTAGAGGWTGSVQGYYLASKGTTPRLVGIEVDGNGPYTFAENDTYDITANITYA